MESPSLLERRKVARSRRRRPTGMQVRVLVATGDGALGPETGPTPTDLRLETTYEDGSIVAWFDDYWWIELLRRWKERPLTIHMLPTADALLHPVVLHELEMVRRLTTPWRLIGHCYLSDIGHPSLLRRVAVNPYDEIRVIDADRPSTESFETAAAVLTLSEIFERVHEIQRDEQIPKPLLTRAPKP